MGWSVVAAGAVLMLGPAGVSQTVEPVSPLNPPSAAPVSPMAIPTRVAATTVVEIEIAEALSSRTAVMDATFPIRLAEPLKDGDRILLPAGTPGMGQVVHSAKAGVVGRTGELLLAARYLEFNGVKVPLRRFRLGGSAKDRSKDALIMIALGMAPAYIMKGNEIEFPAGTRASAVVAATVDLPDAPTIAAPVNPQQGE